MDDTSEFWRGIAVIEDALTALDLTGIAAMTDAQKVTAMTRIRTLEGRVSAAAAVATDAVARSCATERTTGTPLADFLATTEGRTPSQGLGQVFRASRITADPRIRDAALSGRVGPDHAAAIGDQLRTMPRDQMTPDQRDAAADRFLQIAGTTTPGRIGRATPKILEEVAPQAAPPPHDAAAQAAARRRRAVAARRLVWSRDGQGSVHLRGQLPEIEAARIIPVLEAFVEHGRGAERDQIDRLKTGRAAGTITTAQYLAARRDLEGLQGRSTGQRAADALVEMVDVLAGLDQIPQTGGQAPRLVVTLDYDSLRAAVAGRVAGGTLAGGVPVDAGSLRRLCCEAQILPAVLGGGSQVLDVGRARRLVTPGIRRALEIRDRGCIYPGCTVSAQACQAHHVRPWWDGGPTALTNLVLVCRHHHGLIEPDRHHNRDQWQVSFDPHTGNPQIHPPTRLTPHLRRTSGGPGGRPNSTAPDSAGPPDQPPQAGPSGTPSRTQIGPDKSRRIPDPPDVSPTPSAAGPEPLSVAPRPQADQPDLLATESQRPEGRPRPEAGPDPSGPRSDRHAARSGRAGVSRGSELARTKDNRDLPTDGPARRDSRSNPPYLTRRPSPNRTRTTPPQSSPPSTTSLTPWNQNAPATLQPDP
ncbi:DUF222 domain-containing protein [Acidipropionibacterium jensenii]|uniref:HNH endonuclease signature motif containing protein n=1 Tax=Acidipropionibacterium jensenii TaxID=1749 RepID=UPI00110B38CF|nr:HNH endonuclease signature motif containing protein [Acidipropionibacterium jensenii]QCV87486.1 DUF222 domain-containing protein [Acidipropionibacterium jensenii]